MAARSSGTARASLLLIRAAFRSATLLLRLMSTSLRGGSLLVRFVTPVKIAWWLVRFLYLFPLRTGLVVMGLLRPLRLFSLSGVIPPLIFHARYSAHSISNGQRGKELGA
jgi:hypothetical protein